MSTIQNFLLHTSTETLDLLRNFQLAGFDPGLASYKGGGVFQDSPFTDTRRLIFRRHTNAQMSAQFTLSPSGSKTQTTAAIARDLQLLRRILEQAAEFWSSNWFDNPVWVEIQAEGESNPRYAYVAVGQVPRVPMYFEGTFHSLDGSIVPYLPLVMERTHWMTVAPGGTIPGIPLIAGGTFDGQNYGSSYQDDEATAATRTDKEIFVSNRAQIANITDIYTYDDFPIPTVSANLVDSFYATPRVTVPLATDPNASGDYTYYGCDSSITGSGPFASIVVNVETAGVGTTFGEWEYSQGGSSWASLGPTEYWNATGYQVLWFSPPDDWATDTFNGVTAYWLRHDIASTGNYTTTPYAEEPIPFAVNWNWVDIDANDIDGGELPIVTKVSMYPAATGVSRLLLGLRALDRGDNFRSILGIDNDQFPTAEIITAAPSRGSKTIVPSAADGTAVQWASGGVAAMGTVYNYRILDTTAAQYRGRFRLFLRVRQTTGSSVSFKFRIQIAEAKTSVYDITTKTVANQYFNASDWELIDFGVIELGAENYQGLYSPSVLEIFVQAQATASDTIEISDLIFLPVDEWSAEITSTDNRTFNQNNAIILDGTTDPKRIATATNFDYTETIYYGRLQPILARHPLLYPRRDCRLWFLIADGAKANPDLLMRVKVQGYEQYLDLRGTE